MSEPTTLPKNQFSPQASLAGLLAHLKARGIFDELQKSVQLKQKTVKDSSQDKLLDILLTLLCGAQSLVQLNTLLQADPALQQAAGRTRCTEQNVAQMQQMLTTLLRRHSQVARHSTLAHNLLIWVRRWLAAASPVHAQHLQHYGIKQMI